MRWCVCSSVLYAQTDSSVCVSMCTRERQRAQRAAGKAACSSGGGQRGRETERLKHRERAAAGTLRFGWLNTIQSSSHPNPQPAHKPVRDVSQIGALLQPLFWQVSHRACHFVYTVSKYCLTRAPGNASAYCPSYSLASHVTRLPSLPL